jgi:hypothetical protein
LPVLGDIGVQEHQVINGPEQRYFVASGFFVVLEDGGNRLLTGEDGHQESQ